MATGTATATATATPSRSAVTGTCTATITVPAAAPATVPMLQPACIRGSTERPMACSTVAPWTFMATSQAPLPNPNKNSPAATGAMPYW